MCHFISAVLPASADLPLLEQIASAHGRRLQPLNNPSVRALLKPGEGYFLTTQGHCDCGTSLGEVARAESQLPKLQNAVDTKEQKLRRKGWTAAKVARWREQKVQHLQSPRDSVSDEITRWLSLLKQILTFGGSPYIGLLLHWYDGQVEDDIEISERQAVPFKLLGPEFLGRLKEDVLYDFRA
jgi:hypothetical protein